MKKTEEQVVEQVTEEVAVTEEKTEKQEETVSIPEPVMEEPIKDEPKKYTLVEVREKLSELQKAGKRDKVKELLNSFGASKLPEVPEDKYAELMEKAGEL